MKWTHFQSVQKALDLARWLNFTNRKRKERFAVVNGPEDDFVVMHQTDALENDFSIIDGLSTDYADMAFKHIESIRTDSDPLKHWEDIMGEFAIMDGEILRFILKVKIPLERLIRYELAIRGYDQDGRWIGFEASKKLWLK